MTTTAMQIGIYFITLHNTIFYYYQGRKYWEGPAIKRQRLKEISRVENEVKLQSDRIQELEKIVGNESGSVYVALYK
jgi:hypothetical protein